MSRLPIRLRLTVAFALAMAALLSVTGAFLYFRLGYELNEVIDDDLEARAAEVAAAVTRNQSDPSRLPGARVTDPGERFVQVLASDGSVVDASPPALRRPLVRRDQIRRAAEKGAFVIERDDVPVATSSARMLVTPVPRSNRGLVLVVGVSLEERNETARDLLNELLIAGPAALVLASLLAYALARAALRPVESMRTEAAAISSVEPGRRLPLPRSRDEVRRLGETLNAMLGRLETAVERERSFVADASHELRTPLALLKAELELALRRPRSAAELEQALRSAAVETDRLARLAEDLLVLARSDQGRLRIRRAPVRAAELLSGVAERFRPGAESAGRAIEVKTQDGLQVAGDSVLLEQAVGNLVENALRHGSGAVRLTAAEGDSRVELHVVDEGTGFPSGFVERAFERFSRADEARSGDGAGLGLAIVNVIAGAHGGSAHAVNRQQGGADVWISLPKA